jgi:hypothetical protein
MKSTIARRGRLYKRNGPMGEAKKNKPALELHTTAKAYNAAIKLR